MSSKTQNRKHALFAIALGACMTTALVSCGGDSSSSSSRGARQEEEADDVVYRAVLVPVNSSSNALASGTVTVRKVGDQFTVEGQVTDAPNATHRQHIHTGTACPNAASDANNDGVIDVVEAVSRTGRILIPLDSDLNAQELGAGNYPSGSGYTYSEGASYGVLEADLRIPDLDPTDAVVKLAAGESARLLGRAVLVHGVPESTTLPTTAQGIDGLSPQAALPIACGLLVEVADDGSTGGTSGGTSTGGTAGGTTGGTTGGL